MTTKTPTAEKPADQPKTTKTPTAEKPADRGVEPSIARFSLVGDPKDGGSGPYGKDGKEDTIVKAFGLEFRADAVTNVDDPKIIAKLRGNAHFKEVKE